MVPKARNSIHLSNGEIVSVMTGHDILSFKGEGGGDDGWFLEVSVICVTEK